MTQPNEVFSQDAEEAVLGALLIAPQYMDEALAIVSERDFFLLRHRMVFAALFALHSRGDAVDFVTAQAELANRKQLVDIGGPGYLLGLINNTPTSIHLTTYAQLVRRYALRRSMLEAAGRISALAVDMQLETGDALDQAVAAVMDLGSLATSSFRDMPTLINANMDRVEHAIEHPGQVAGVPSSFPRLSSVLGGYVDGRAYIVGGRPGTGKSSFLISEAVFMAQLGYKVGIISLEMTEQDMTNAIVGIVAGVSPKKIAEGELSPEEYARYVKAAADVAALPIYIADDEDLTPRQVMGLVRAWQRAHGMDVLMIDYLQYMKPPVLKGNHEYPSEYAQVTAIATALGKLAKRLRLPLLIAAQLNREVENRADKRPTLGDLKSTGKIEEMASVVLFPYRDAYVNPPVVPQAIQDVEIGIAKNRFGPTGMVRAVFIPELKHFRSSAPIAAPKGV